MYVLKYTMMGQQWLEGNVELHSTINIDTLLIHGEEDALITIAEAEQTEQVGILTCNFIILKNIYSVYCILFTCLQHGEAH